MTCRLFFLGVFLLALELSTQPADPFIRTSRFETAALRVSLTNDGRLQDDNYGGGIWLKKEWHGGVWDHGLIVIGYRDGELVGTAPLWSSNYTPGPILNKQAALVVAPLDSTLYRTYMLTQKSKLGDRDYDEWPVQWGAPMENGRPKLYGDMTAYTVYNDAHPEVHSYIEQQANTLTNTNVEIHETVWGYDRPGLLGQSLFFKWEIINKNSVCLDDVMIAHWNDIDLFASDDRSCFSEEYGFGYIFTRLEGQHPFSCAASYVQLEGPYTFMTDDMGAKYHLPISAYWALIDDGGQPQFIGAEPDNLQQLYYFLTGRRHDGSPIINPVTGDTTRFVYTGDPVSQTGWLQTVGGGGCGGISAAGPLSIAAGDTQSVTYALVFAEGETAEFAWNQLLGHVKQINDFYHKGIVPPDSEPAPLPLHFSIKTNYPNPFNGQTTIRYTVPLESELSIKIYNTRGQFIKTVVNHVHTPGEYTAAFSPDASLSSGVFLYRLQTPYGNVTKKMTYTK
jgi:hypothetical protein